MADGVSHTGIFQEASIDVYGKAYKIRVCRLRKEDVHAPRLVIVAYLPNRTACDMLRLCIESIRRFTPETHELWVVDNCSPPAFSNWLAHEPGINVIFNLVKPVPGRGLRHLLKFRQNPPYAGSYANAVALEIASRMVDPDTKVMMTLHMDTAACRSGWLSYLREHLSDEVRCVGVRMDEVREKVIHVLGMMFDFTLFRPLKLTYQHNMPAYDVGDAISIALNKAGYGVWACRNTLWQPELVSLIPEDSPFRYLNVDRSLDDDNQVIFMHLGRGICKSIGEPHPGKTTPAEWLTFGRDTVLKDSLSQATV
jgi:hypothetical protein